MEEPRIHTGRTSCGGDSTSPEFEFWMVRNPSFPQPNLLSADELFSHGVLLPLQQLNLSNDPDPSGSDRVAQSEPSATESAELSANSTLSSSKRWRDIFRKSNKKSAGNGDDHSLKERESSVKERRREKKNGGGASSTELNINIWPFARSRSAGNGGIRPRTAAANRKVSSAPCSRSNSRGESKSRKWPTSPGRAGVHIGRSSPVWQVRRSGGGGRQNSETVAVVGEKGVKKDGNEERRRVPVAGGSKARVLSLNVPMCIGYRQNFSCKSGEISTGGVATGGCQSGAAASGEGVRGNNLFNIRSLFTKKVY